MNFHTTKIKAGKISLSKDDPYRGLYVHRQN